MAPGYAASVAGDASNITDIRVQTPLQGDRDRRHKGGEINAVVHLTRNLGNPLAHSGWEWELQAACRMASIRRIMFKRDLLHRRVGGEENAKRAGKRGRGEARD